MDEQRKQNGQFTNSFHDNHDPRTIQNIIDYILHNSGQSPTSEGIRSSLGFLYILSILGNIHMPDEAERPNSQRAVQNTSAAFEADTFVEVRQEGKEFTMYSLTSSSTANSKRIIPSFQKNPPVRPIIESEPLTDPFLYLANKAHQWSIEKHQIAHGISELANCTTVGEFSYQKRLGLWENVNHTQVHFKSICQTAIADAQKSNHPRTKHSPTFQHFYFNQRKAENDSPYFTSSDATEKLKDLFHSKGENDEIPKNHLATIRGIRKTTPEVTTFWKDLTEGVPTFFYDYLTAFSIVKPQDTAGNTLITHFLEWFVPKISNYQETQESPSTSTRANIPTPKRAYLPRHVQISHARTNEMTLKKEVASSLWSLPNKMIETIDQFLQRWDPLKVTGAEAAVVVPKVNLYMKDADIQIKSYEEVSIGDIDMLTHEISNYLQQSYTRFHIPEPRMPFWYDFDVFQNRHKTEIVNSAVIRALCEIDEAWCEYQNFPIRPFFGALQAVENRETPEIVRDRRRFMAWIILDKSGLSLPRLSDDQADAIFLQWRNNNVFCQLRFKQIKNIPLISPYREDEIITLPTQEADLTVRSTSIPDDPEVVKIKKIIEAVDHNQLPPEEYRQSQPVFYYMYDLFINRGNTLKVNQNIKWYLGMQNVKFLSDSKEDFIFSAKTWIRKNEENEDSFYLAKVQFFAYYILKLYGVAKPRFGEQLSPHQIQAIFDQWEINTILGDWYCPTINEHSTYYKISPAEEPFFVRMKDLKKESDLLYDLSIKRYIRRLSYISPVVPYVYYRKLFDKRDQTESAFKKLCKWIADKHIPLEEETLHAMVRTLQSWMSRPYQYTEMIERVKTMARKILESYDVQEDDLTLEKAYAIFLQLGNNYAQHGKVLDTNKVIYGMEMIKNREKQEIKDAIDSFLNENKISPSNQLIEQKIPFNPDAISEKKAQIKQRMTKFFANHGVSIDTSNINALVLTALDWVLFKDAPQETIDMVKVKQLAQVILGRELDGVISNEEATITFRRWAGDAFEVAPPSLLETKEATKTVDPSKIVFKPSNENLRWRSKRLRDEVELFFRQKGLVSKNSSKEALVIALGRWLTQDGVGMVLMDDKIQPVAQVILKELDLYGGLSDEKISHRDAELTVMKWVIENVLDSSVEAYIVKNILAVPDLSTYTIGQLRKLFEIDELIKSGAIDPKQVNANHEVDSESLLKKIWVIFIKKILPNYFLETSQLSDDLLISDYDSLVQLVGSKLLEDAGYRTEFNQMEIRKLGTFFCGAVGEKGVSTIEELNYLLIPALLSTAQLNPVGLRKALAEGKYKEFALDTFIAYWKNRSSLIQENQTELHHLFLIYQEAVIKWRRKQAITNVVVQECSDRGAILPRLLMGESYLGGEEPCPNQFTPPPIEDTYVKLTKAVSDTFFSFDQKLIELSFNALATEERQFIFSSGARIYAADARLENQVRYYAPSAPGVMPATQFFGRETWLDGVLNLERTDLFVVVKGSEERWYGLKILKEEGGYIVYRVDKNPMLYLDYGLLEQKAFLKEGYQVDGEGIRIGKKHFVMIIEKQNEIKVVRGSERKSLIDFLGNKHRDELYKQLYAAGDDKTIVEKVWDFVKHFIPFYDCVVGIIDQDVTEAVFSCTIDVVLLIPVFGQVYALNTKFALGMAKSMVKSGIKGGLKSTIKHSKHLLPTRSELKGLLTSVIHFVDPGFDLLIGGGSFLIRHLLRLKDQLVLEKEVLPILKKLEKLEEKEPHTAQNLILARLPKNGPKIYVKLIKDQLYLPVTNLRRGDVFGEYFTLHNDRLRNFKGSVFFTVKQKEVIKQLTKRVALYQTGVLEKNVNPLAYGEGKILTVEKKDQETERFITMNGQLVPVFERAIKNQGVRYDLVAGDKSYPVNFNGIEWYFEPETSPMLSKEVKEQVIKKLDQYEALKDPSTLSPPDENGLMRNAEGRTYIVIEKHYLPLILLNEQNERYHLVKKDILEPMTILRLDPESEQFRFETPSERREIEFAKRIYRAGGKEEVSKGGISSPAQTSLDAEEGPSSSDYNKIPETPGKAEQWNLHRGAVPLPEEKITVENDSEKMGRLEKFIPEPTPQVAVDQDEELKAEIYEGICEYIGVFPTPNFRVFAGLDPSQFPDFLQPFHEKFGKEFNEAITIFQTVKEKGLEWLKQEKISETEAGSYLIPMFRLADVSNREEILREITKRLVSIAEKGERFLQQSADWGFENFLFASTDLVKDAETQNYYSKIQQTLGAQAFAVKDDPECRIVMMVDAFHLDPKLWPQEEILPDAKSLIVHETTHIVSLTQDYLFYDYAAKGFNNNGKKTLAEYTNKFSTILASDGYEKFVQELAEVLGIKRLSRKTVAEALEVDPMLRANLQMTEADMVMVIIRDLAQGNGFDQILPRVKRDLEKAGLGHGFLLMAFAITHVMELVVLERKKILERTREETEQSKEQDESTPLVSVSTSTPEHQAKRSFSERVNVAKIASTFLNETLVNSQVKRKRSELNLQV